MNTKGERRRGPDQGNRDASKQAQFTTAPRPVTVSDKTCFAVCGVEPGPWKRALSELRVPNTKIGRRTVARLDDWLAAVDRATGRGAPEWNEDAIIARAAGGAK